VQKESSYITTSGQLRNLSEQALTATAVAIDTEFIREKTFWPKLCLLQLAFDQHSVIIDPLRVTDLSPLAALLTAPGIVKVFHSSEQDLEIIFHKLGLVPNPLFDTQVAAELLGMAQQVSLSTLVREYCGIRLSKADSFTDWQARPLTNSQKQYALDDVRYLPRIYHDMHSQLSALGRLSWLEEDFAALGTESRYRPNPDMAWQRVKHASTLTQRQLGILQELAKSREEIAMYRDLPRRWVVSDELLVQIAKTSPQNLQELHRLRGAQNQLGRRWGNAMLQAVQRGLSLVPEQLPERKGLQIGAVCASAAVDLLRSLLNQRARQNGITAAMLANKDDLLRLASGQRANIKVLEGWRYQIVGRELLELMEGTLSLRIQGEELEVNRHKATLEAGCQKEMPEAGCQ
jgi:ribonuclease D